MEKKRKILYSFSEEEPILSIKINNYEIFMILGSSIGNATIYKIDIESENGYSIKKDSIK